MTEAIINEIRRVGSLIVIGMTIFSIVLGVILGVEIQRIKDQNKQIIELIQQNNQTDKKQYKTAMKG